jgi:hypothetical protein
MTTNKAHEVLHEIARLFEDPERLVGGMAATFIRANGDRPIDNWSWGNRMLAWLNNTVDARTFNQWRTAGRSIQRGAKAFCILAPCTYKMKAEDEDKDTVKKVKVVGFRAVPVFRIQDTHGAVIRTYEPPALPPLSEVPKKWGITVDYEPIPGEAFGIRGSYNFEKKQITLFTELGVIIIVTSSKSNFDIMVKTVCANASSVQCGRNKWSFNRQGCFY